MPIHPSAIVDPRAEVDPTAELGPYVVVEGRVRIGPRTRVMAGAYLTGQTEIAGVPYQTLAEYKGVQHLGKFDDASALILTDGSGSLDLKTIALP